MNKSVFISGIVLIAAGLLALPLLDQLRAETFRVDLEPWIVASYVVVFFGCGIALLGAAKSDSSPARLGAARTSTYFTFVSLINTLASGVFVLPILDPALEFPILITRWPGIYMVIAFFSFVSVGVLGNMAWSSLFRSLAGSNDFEGVSRYGFWLQVVLTELGVLGLAVFMFLGGYVGSTLDYSGLGPSIVGSEMEFAVIPSALSIFLVVAGEFLGVFNAIKAFRTDST